MKILGQGIKTMHDFALQCSKNEDNKLVIRTTYGGKALEDKVFLFCISLKRKEVLGGAVTDLPKEIIKGIRKEEEKTRVDFSTLRKILAEKKMLPESSSRDYVKKSE